MRKKIKIEEDKKKEFIILNELAEAFCGLKGGYPQFTENWEIAKPMNNEQQFKNVQKGTTHKLEIMYI